jgi:5-formyltetrahydrofolate cyclo-ligase
VTKAELRREMRTRLAAPVPNRTEKSRMIVAAIANHLGTAGLQRIALFSPLPSEPDVELLWTAAPGRFCYPRVVRGAMEFVDVEKLDDLAASSWHPQIREHSITEAAAVQPAEIVAILVPGLAFTKDGRRLGRGGGYYDRYLAGLPAGTVKIGVCFAVQIVEALPTEPHDQRVNLVVTENDVFD